MVERSVSGLLLLSAVLVCGFSAPVQRYCNSAGSRSGSVPRRFSSCPSPACSEWIRRSGRWCRHSGADRHDPGSTREQPVRYRCGHRRWPHADAVIARRTGSEHPIAAVFTRLKQIFGIDGVIGNHTAQRAAAYSRADGPRTTSIRLISAGSRNVLFRWPVSVPGARRQPVPARRDGHNRAG